MTYYCKIYDSTINLGTKHKQIKSRKHTNLEDFFIMRFIVENHDSTQLNGIMKRYIDVHNKKYDLNHVRCVLEVNDNQYLTYKLMLNLDFTTYPNITIENQPCFSQVLELRITFISSHRHMTYDYYLKQPMPMCEMKLNYLLYKTAQLINSFNRFNIYPFFQENANISAGEKCII